jgi:putative OPT family oligopeptide transporter
VAFILGKFNFYALDHQFSGISIGSIGASKVRLGQAAGSPSAAVGGVTSFAAPEVSPAYLGVGYVIGPKLASLQFSGGVLAWGLMVPLLIYFLGPQMQPQYTQNGATDWNGMAAALWRFIVRPIAVGGMLVGSAFTLFKMRNSLVGGLSRAFAEVRGDAPALETLSRTERYMSSKIVLALIGVMFLLMIGLYYYFAGNVGAALVAATVMLIVGFVFAVVSGSLVGVIGSSNNPISGLTLSTLIIAALLMVAMGFTGINGVAVVLGVAAVVCVSSAVAGELLQDFKVGYILGGTPRTIQVVELVSVLVASLVMFIPLWILNEGDIRDGGTGFGGKSLPAPQAGLMAMLAQGIVGGEMAWPLVVAGIFFGIVLIMAQVRSPMLVAVGMYLPFGTTFAIFCGGMTRWLAEAVARRQGYNPAQLTRVENAGILTASGLIAGEALVGLLYAGLQFKQEWIPDLSRFAPGGSPSYLLGFLVLAALAILLVRWPLSNAGSPDEPAPPAAMV